MTAGDYTLIVDKCFQVFVPSRLKVNFAIELNKRLDKVRAKHSPLSILPKDENETSADWYQRYLEYLGKDSTRRDGESVEEFMDRTFETTTAKDNFRQLFDYVVEIADMVGQTLAPANELDELFDKFLDNAVIDDVILFLYSIMKKCRLNTSELE